MGFLGFVKDACLLPIDVALDVTCINPIRRLADISRKSDNPFGTIDRLASMAKNIEDTLK